MAFAPSPGDVIALIQFAWDLCNSCHAAPTELHRAQGKVLALCINLECSQESIVGKNTVKQSLKKSFGTLLNLCKSALKDVQAILLKYPGKEMSIMQRLKWTTSDKSDFDEAISYLEYLTTQLDKLLEKVDGLRAGQIEKAFDDTDDADAAVKQTLKGRQNLTPVQQQITKHYANFVAQERNTNPRKPKSSSYLECWTVTKATVSGVSKFDAEKDTRGQWKLREIAADFRASTLISTAAALAEDDRVKWILKGSRDAEKNPTNFDWKLVAARRQKCSFVVLGVTVDEQIMVILKRFDRNKPQKPKVSLPPAVGVTTKAPSLPPPGPDKKATSGQCKYWPNCSKPSCTYFHPLLRPSCFNGAICEAKGCRYTHPALDPTVKPCRNGTKCSTKGCHYAHRRAKLCRDYPNGCTKVNKGCPYVHKAMAACHSGSGCVTPGCKYTHPAIGMTCKNGAGCKDKGCRYGHGMVHCFYGKGCTRPTCTYGH